MGISAKDFVFNLLTDSSKAEKGMDGFVKIAQGAAAGAAAAWAGAKIGDAMEGAFDTESAQAKLTASLGLLPEESERIGKVAGSLFSQAYGENIGEVNTAVSSVIGSFAGMRDASSADLEDMTARAITFSTVFEEDITRATQVAAQMVTQGIAVDGVHAFDLLTVAMQKMPVALRGDLLDAVDEYGGFFTTLGISGDKAMGMLVAASADGMYGIDKTGDAIKEFGIRASDMSKATQGAFTAIGLNGEEMADAFATGGEVSGKAFAQVVDGLLSIEDPSLRANTAIALFGTPIEDLNGVQIPQFLTSLQSTTDGLGDVAGATDKMTEGMGQTMNSMIESKKHGLDMWVQSLVDLPGPLAEVTAGLMAFGPGALEVLGAVGPFVALTAARIAGTASTVANTSAMVANSAAWYANPVVLIVMGIIAAIALLAFGIWQLVANWDTVIPWLGNFFSTIGTAVWDFLVGFGEMLGSFVPVDFILDNFNKVTVFFDSFFGNLMGGVELASDWIGGKVGEIVGFFTSIPDRIGEAWFGLVSLIQGVVKTILSYTVDVWNSTLGSIDFDLPLGLGHIQFPQFSIPALAEGGIVNSPTLALIGEAGPEAVVPLSKFRGGSGSSEIIEIHTHLSLDGREIAKTTRRIEAENAF